MSLYVKDCMPESTDDLWKRGHALLEGNDFSGAFRVFQLALSLEPDDHELHHIAGLTLQRMGRHTEATEHFRAAIRRYPMFPEAYADLGDSLANIGQQDLARDAYLNVIKFTLPGEEAHEQAMSGLGELDS